MATETLTHPLEEEVLVTEIETPSATTKVETTTTPEGKKTEISRVEKPLTQRVADAAKRGWKSFLNGLSWMRQQVSRFYSWTKTQARRTWTKSVEYAKLGIAKSGAAARYAGNWVKDAAVGAWQFTAPVRNWIATPFRVAVATSGGLAAVYVFGGQFLIGLATIWLAYLLFSGQKVSDHQKTARKLQATDSDSVTVQIAPDTRVLTEAQMQAISNRIDDLENQAQAANGKGNKNMFSEVEGRIYLATQRLKGSTVNVNQIAKEHKAKAEADMGVEKAREHFTWSAVKRGMQTEHGVIEKLIDTNSDSKLPASV